jgi:hypothetical protein
LLDYCMNSSGEFEVQARLSYADEPKKHTWSIVRSRAWFFFPLSIV